MMVLDRVGGGGREKLGLVAGWMGFGAAAGGAWLRCWLMAGGGRLKVLSATDDCASSLPAMLPDAAGVGGRLARGIVEEQIEASRIESDPCGGNGDGGGSGSSGW